MQVASRKYARVPLRCVTLVSDVCPRIRGSRGARGQRASASLPLSQLAVDKDPVLLWFKSDLRTDDHEGLAALVRAPAVLPVFVLDPHQLEPLTFSPAGPEVLLATLHQLRAALRAAGSELLVVRGRWEEVLPTLAGALGARAVVMAEEVEERLAAPAAAVVEKLEQDGVTAFHWSACTWNQDQFKFNYKEWAAGRGAPQPPLEAPLRLPPPPPLPPGMHNPGDLPAPAALREELEQQHASSLAAPGVASLAQQVLKTCASGREAQRQAALIASGRTWLQLLTSYLHLGGGAPGGKAAAAGAPPMASSGAGGSIEQQMRSWVAELEGPAAEGASFPALFATALALGAVSRRRVYQEVVKARALATPAAASPLPWALPLPTPLPGREEATPPDTPLTSQQLQVCRTAAAVCAESADFHWQLARSNGQRAPNSPATVQQHHWRWRGFLTDYCVAEPSPEKAVPGAPAVLLIHGFGAFGDHWRGNLAELADAGFRVFAPTLPGFGRSEKAAVPYSQVLWTEFIRDFSLCVVKGPVVMAGNSIGGFIATSAAADVPQLVRGLVLLNSAGPIDPGFNSQRWQQQVAAKTPPPPWLVKAVSSALFWYLERSVPGTLKWVYPVQPQRADDWLAGEIGRASADIGSLAVFASVFYLPAPRALNWLINTCFKGPVMVLQGALDPLNDSPGRARQLGQLCPQYVKDVVLLKAGHCPHDEVPHLVNQEMIKFMRERILPVEEDMVDASTASSHPGVQAPVGV